MSGPSPNKHAAPWLMLPGVPMDSRFPGPDRKNQFASYEMRNMNMNQESQGPSRGGSRGLGTHHPVPGPPSYLGIHSTEGLLCLGLSPTGGLGVESG